MKGIVIKEVELKVNHSSESNTIAVLKVGDRIDILKPRFSFYEIKWVYIQIKDDVKGFIKQENFIEIDSKYTFVERSAEIYSEASANSTKSFVLPNQAQIKVSNIVSNEEGMWYEIKDSLGRAGMMNSVYEIELTRELVDDLSRDKGDMLKVFANAGIIGGPIVIAYAIFRLIYVYYRSESISGISILILCVGVLAIIIDIFRKKMMKN
ncbi:MAG: hypothetical protein Q8880_13335, partial [Bacteroidota bacterium]|nr:hypothetical protein [Bacteroidota bacterium]